ncbi:MAG: hypothetical protein E6Q98_07935 [Rhodospirillaceae bacterium]|nr:MAG: hypothetical protein E6Q98_07935 [Rhodospirillaceae bacterium]
MQSRVHQTPLHHNETVIGVLTEEKASKADIKNYRFTALDPRFRLLDGSKFSGFQKAMAAINRVGHFVDRPVPANER